VIASEHLRPDQSEEFDLIALWRILWKYRVLILSVSAAFAAIAVVLALIATPVYRAEVVISPARDSDLADASGLANKFGGLASLVGVNLSLGDSGQQSQVVLESRNMVEEFIKRHVTLPVLFAGSSDKQTLWLGVKRFREGILKIDRDERQGLTTVSIDWIDPDTAALWANQFVALANELLRQRALQESQRNIDYINRELARTDVVELRQAMFDIIETETKRLMLANGRAEYAFMVVDPAVAPEIRRTPKRTLMVIVGGGIGFVLGVLIALMLNVRARYRGALTQP
jgi:uncharacterized protein involved in exopolysaccharide biosynthesis